MPTLAANSQYTFLLNGLPKQRGAYEIIIDPQEQLVGMRLVGANGFIKGCELQPLANWNGGAFLTIDDFLDFAKPIVFV